MICIWKISQVRINYFQHLQRQINLKSRLWLPSALLLWILKQVMI